MNQSTILFILFIVLCRLLLSGSMQHVVLWLMNYENAWEQDFLRDIFPPSSFFHIHISKFVDNFNQSKVNESIHNMYHPRILVYSVENSGNDGRYQFVRDYILRFKPLVLIHLSDEFQGWSKEWKYGAGVELYQYVRPYKDFYVTLICVIIYDHMHGMQMFRCLSY
jgi:hypothetical protein